ncbi:hypothetical protein N9B10_03785 [Pirellulales bacterium]|nr:hypothetical protein [Pirellulales bacterium]
MAKKQQNTSNGLSKVFFTGLAVCVGAGVLMYFFSGTNLASETMAMQRQLLEESSDPISSKNAIREIMRNIDQLPAQEIRKVRQDLGRSVGQLSKQSAEKYLQLSKAERPAFLDEGLGKMQVAMALFDATNPGGMPIRTQEDVDRRERYRRQKEAAKKKPPEEQKTPEQRKLEQKSTEKSDDGEKKKPTISPEKLYFEALLKRAEEKNIDLGRFGRYYGGGRRRRP